MPTEQERPGMFAPPYRSRTAPSNTSIGNSQVLRDTHETLVASPCQHNTSDWDVDTFARDDQYPDMPNHRQHLPSTANRPGSTTQYLTDNQVQSSYGYHISLSVQDGVQSCPYEIDRVTSSAASQGLALSRPGTEHQKDKSPRPKADAKGLPPLKLLTLNLLGGPSLSEEWRAWVEEVEQNGEEAERGLFTDEKGLQRGARSMPRK
jgi:hypothetical protein